VPRDHDLDLEALAREFERTGELIKNVVVRAACLAAREDTVLDTGLRRRARARGHGAAWSARRSTGPGAD